MIKDPDGADSIFSTGEDAILFSIRQIIDPNDSDGFYATGSELFVVEAPPNIGDPTTYSFLMHGGHAWDHQWTLDNMKAGADGRQLDLNALEAVSTPEPNTMLLAFIGLVMLLGLRLARKRSRERSIAGMVKLSRTAKVAG